MRFLESSLENSVDSMDDPVTGLDVKFHNGCSSLGGLHRHSLTEDVINGSRDCQASTIQSFKGGCAVRNPDN